MTSSNELGGLSSELENGFASMWAEPVDPSQHFDPEIGLIAAALTTQFNGFCQNTIAKCAFTDGVSHLSFQFLARREINAYAFRREGKAFVAVNLGVPEALLDTARQLVGHPDVRGVFAEIYSGALEVNNLAALIMVSGVTFIFAHEISHHYSAHLHHLRPENRRAILDESLDELNPGTVAFLDRQALEVQADSFAMSRSLANLNDPAWRDDAMDLLGIKTGSWKLYDCALPASLSPY